MASNSVGEAENRDISRINLHDLSGREIHGIAEKVAKKKGLTELNRHRVSPSLKSEPVIVTIIRLGIPEERVAALLKINRKAVKKHAENPRLIKSLKKVHLNAVVSDSIAVAVLRRFCKVFIYDMPES
jgi:DNA invertase Pin-like site-specific DNA recombinase